MTKEINMNDEKVNFVDETSKEILQLLHRDYEVHNEIAIIFITIIYTTARIFEVLFESNPDKTDKDKQERFNNFIETLTDAVERQTGVTLNDH